MKLYHYITLIIAIITLSSFGEANKLKAKKVVTTEELQRVKDSIAAEDVSFEDDSIVIGELIEGDFEIISEETKASYYHDKFIGRKTASGEVFDNEKYTAAHKSLPFGTKIKVTNLRNKRSVVLTVTDRGPFIKGRSVDISKRAFMDLTDNLGRGILDVKVERLVEDLQ